MSSRLSWNSLLAAVILVPLAIGIMPLSGIPLTLNMFVVPKLVVLALTMALALGGWALGLKDEGGLRAGRALVPLGVFLAVAALAAVFALDPRLAVFGDFEQGVGLLVFELCGLACFLASQLVRDAARLRQLTSAVVLTSAGIAVIGLLQQVFALDLLGFDVNALPAYLVKRGYGTIGNADTYGTFLVLPALLALHRLATAATPKERTKWGACFVLMLVSCVASQTRAALAGLVVGGILYWLLARRAAKGAKAARPASRGVGLLVAAGVAGGILVAAFLTFGSVDRGGSYRDFAARFGSLGSLLALGGRIPLWQDALRVAAAHPLLGVGPDSFRLGWYAVRPVAQLGGGATLVITDPHGVPLLVAATMGVLGLAAIGYLLAATLRLGFATVRRTEKASASDYLAWLCGATAVTVALLASMLTTVIWLTLSVALGVLIAPSLAAVRLDRAGRAAVPAARVAALLVAGAFAAFALLTTAAHLTAVGARGEDADINAARAAKAAALAPWDTSIRDLDDGARVQAALDHVFKEKPDATEVVSKARAALAAAAAREPRDYALPYNSALLLIGVGQKLGDVYTKPGVEAGLRGLELYPNSLQLRTGVGSGYVALGEPAKAVALLKDVWDADPRFAPSGVTYVEALVASGKTAEARTALAALEQRFPGEESVKALNPRVPAK